MTNAELIARARDKVRAHEQIGDYSAGLYMRLADALEKTTQRLEAAEEAVKFIAEYPNGPENHTGDCELHKVDATQDDWDDVACCTCGYWAESFAQLKIAGLEKWRSLKAGS